MIPTEERILAIDYGSRWLGCAWSDPSRTIVAGSRTIDRQKTAVPIPELFADLVSELSISLVVVGMPYNMDGSAGFKAKETINFMKRLKEKLNIPVIHWDERLTTVRAEEELRRLNTNTRRKRERRVDEMSASFILQSYLQNISSHSAGEENP